MVSFSEVRYQPLWRLSPKHRAVIKAYVAHELRKRMIDAGFVNSMKDVMIREAFPGGDANTTDFKDFLLGNGTGVRTGQEGWGIDNAWLTANTPSNIVSTTAGNPAGGQVPTRSYIGIYGFWDKDPNPDLYQIIFKNGQNTVDVWQPLDECYIKPEKGCGAMTLKPIIYGPKDLMNIQVTHISASYDRDIGFFMLIAEQYGEQVTKTV